MQRRKFSLKERHSPKHKLTLAEHTAGGYAHAAVLKKRKARQVNAVAKRFGILAGLEDLKWRPALQTLARVSLTLERCYQVLRERESLLDKDGELCKSIDVFRRLAETQAVLLKSVGLVPGASLPMLPDGEIEAAYQRIEAIKRVTTNGKLEEEST